MTERIIVGYDAKRIVRNATGLGSYGRTLVNDLSQSQPSLQLRLYAPDQGRDDLRCQVCEHENIRFCYPAKSSLPFSKALWRTRGIISDLQRDGVQIYHGLTGELPIGIRKSGIRADVGIAGDKSGLIALGASDHSRLALNALRPVNKGHAAALSQCHCQAVAGYRLHDRGDHGDGQLDRRLLALTIFDKRSFQGYICRHAFAR